TRRRIADRRSPYRSDLCRTAAGENSNVGMRSNYRDRLRTLADRKLSASVLQEHRPLFFHLLSDGGVGGGINAGDLRRMLIGTHRKHRSQNAMHHIVEYRNLHVAVLDRQLNAFILNAFEIASRRLLLVESGCGCLYRAMGPVPVGHDEALESPLVFEDLGKQVRV